MGHPRERAVRRHIPSRPDTFFAYVGAIAPRKTHPRGCHCRSFDGGRLINRQNWPLKAPTTQAPAGRDVSDVDDLSGALFPVPFALAEMLELSGTLR